MKKAIMYGAGNIGRGFIGDLFFKSGYEVVFIDVNMDVINEINKEKRYPIKVVSRGGQKEIIVENIRGIDGRNIDLISDEISDADIMATAVGVNILPFIVSPIAKGLKKRWQKENMEPLNIIICENLLNADSYLAELIKKELNKEEKEYFNKTVGLVEASIGRMVPVMTEDMKENNLLKVWVEEYGELPVDKNGFKGEIPKIINMYPFTPFEFFIHRKLFIHNLGHSIAAYLGNLEGYKYIWEAMDNPYIKQICLKAMQDSAKALSIEHNVSLQAILEHVDDLIYRFGNKYLGDTVERVGKDPTRKLSSNDRLVGASNLCFKHSISPIYISIGIAAALFFRFENDLESIKVQSKIAEIGIKDTIKEITNISNGSILTEHILKFYNMFKEKNSMAKILDTAEMSKNRLENF